MTVLQWVWIALGGALGAMLRGAVSLWLESSFPWATLLVNVLGSLMIGCLLGLEAEGQLPEALRNLGVVGFCGAFTTFSTFSYQTLNLLNKGQTSAALLNIALSLGLTLAAVWLGMRLSASTG